jgi:hypothetical protein
MKKKKEKILKNQKNIKRKRKIYQWEEYTRTFKKLLKTN